MPLASLVDVALQHDLLIVYLGWNDMGEDLAQALTPAPTPPVNDVSETLLTAPEVVKQREALAARLAAQKKGPADASVIKSKLSPSTNSSGDQP